jgi:hypothetical protein
VSPCRLPVKNSTRQSASRRSDKRAHQAGT